MVCDVLISLWCPNKISVMSYYERPSCLLECKGYIALEYFQLLRSAGQNNNDIEKEEMVLLNSQSLIFSSNVTQKICAFYGQILN